MYDMKNDVFLDRMIKDALFEAVGDFLVSYHSIVESIFIANDKILSREECEELVNKSVNELTESWETSCLSKVKDKIKKQHAEVVSDFESILEKLGGK